MHTPAAKDGCVGVVTGVGVGVVLDRAVEPVSYVGVFVPDLEAKTFIPIYDALKLEATAKVFRCV